ncbi:efflux RND transporter permease subunit [Moraxella nasovis]|uniref:efflux RND transporter permease subunit n=1 Tax=Moraxella nasovis TaxID=2904121 RepID=UPI001F614E68|nr:efflux RND transporter permease subunit [Moraxella nasovis]UNU72870.1 efflux RND transporter permease subunit [Moraxella nasovis]
MNFSAYSIKNPLVAILLFTLLTLGGILGFKNSKIQQFPDIDLPGVIVTIPMPGAAPAQLENDIAKKVENSLSKIEGIKHVRTTLQTGAVTIHGEFVLEKDVQEAVDDVRSAVSEVRGDLPAAAQEPIISKVSTAGFPVVSYSVSSSQMDNAQLSWWVDDALSRRLSNLDGVGKIARIGGIERQIIVAADADKLGGWQMPITSLSQQVYALWQDASGGEAKVGGQTQTIRILGASDSIHELQNLQISTPHGTARLADVADVYDGKADETSTALLDNKPVVAFNITRSRGASEVAMVELIDAELDKITKQNPHITIDKIYDHAKPIYDDYKASMQMLIEGCILAVVVVWLFLRNWRATFVTAMALPLSIIPTFLAMYWFNFSLNVISLLALSLVIGVLVDDAIVEVENIIRHLRLGKTPYEAAMEAANEIGLAVIATTFTLIAVFLPTAFMNGVVGQFFSQFGWTAAISVFISLLVARLITPMMAAYILKPEKKAAEKHSQTMTWYIRLVKWALRHRAVTLAVTVVLFIGSLSLSSLLPTGFIPDNDINQTQVTIELTPDASLDDTVKIVGMASDVIGQLDGVDSVFAAVGTAAGGMDSRSASAGSVNIATLDVSLNPRGERPFKSDVEHKISTALQNIAGARFKVGMSSGGETGYSFSLTSHDWQRLSETVRAVVNEIHAIDGVTITTNESLPKPQINVYPDRLSMAEKAVTTKDLADTLRVATVGDYEQALPKLNLDTRQIPISVRLPDEDKQSIETLAKLYLPSSGQASVTADDVARFEFGAGDAQIHRFDEERSVKITVDGDMPLGELVASVKASPTLVNLPSSITIIEEGQAESMNELFGGFVLAMGVGVLCIFGVLMLLFHRVLQPFTILVALPLSVGGAFVGLLITGSSLSMPSMIGFIMLMGIATKNSILLVDYAIIAQNDGKSQFEAIIDACRKRARPIMMTSIAMGAGMLPLVAGFGDGDPTFRRPMAAAVLGGLVTSTFLSLVVIPVVYTLMDDISRKLRYKKATSV